MRYIKSFLFLALLYCTSIVNAQTLFTLDDAISLALENNYGLLIDRNDILVADNNATIGNAGLLPTISGSAKSNYSSLNTETIFGGGIAPADLNGANSYNVAASLDLSYTIFDGFKNKYKLNSLNTTKNIEALRYNANIEKTMMDVIRSYYNLIKIQTDLKNNLESYNYSQQRYTEISNELKFGQNTALEQDKAVGYMNADTSRILYTKLQLYREINVLNKVMGIDTLKGDEQFEDKINLESGITKEALKTQMLTKNIDVQMDEQQIYSSELDLKSAKSNYSPTISLTGSYAFGYQENEVGTMLRNQTLGPSVGITLKQNIFSGNQNKTNKQNAQISLDNSQINLAETKFTLEQDFEKNWLEYQYYLNLIPLEKSNLQIAKNRYEKSENQYKLGQLNSLELRDAQLNMNNANTILNEAIINAKIAEWELMRIAGMILELSINN